MYKFSFFWNFTILDHLEICFHYLVEELCCLFMIQALNWCEIITGVYELIPFYKGENTIFDVSPPSVSVSVEHHHVTVAQKFQVS